MCGRYPRELVNKNGTLCCPPPTNLVLSPFPSLCAPWDPPLTMRPCVLPKDCQLTDWAEWGPCSKTCLDPASPVGARTRSRQVVQFPVGEGAECAALEDSEACEPQGEGVPPCSR